MRGVFSRGLEGRRSWVVRLCWVEGDYGRVGLVGYGSLRFKLWGVVFEGGSGRI